MILIRKGRSEAVVVNLLRKRGQEEQEGEEGRGREERRGGGGEEGRVVEGSVCVEGVERERRGVCVHVLVCA